MWILLHKDRGHYKLKSDSLCVHIDAGTLSLTHTHTHTHAHTHTRASEEIFQLVEDNQVTLSTIKASPYVKAFEKVDYWERTPSHILKVNEMTLHVQRQ